LEEWTAQSGIWIEKRRVPFGVVGIIYEARPNVTSDAAALCIKTGNAALLKGGSDALSSNLAIAGVLKEALAAAGLPAEAIGMIADPSREAANEMMRMNDLVDVLIPRGGAGLIAAVVKNATVPVIETGVGNCHVYVDESADLQMAERIIINAKTSRPSVCNAIENLLVHEGIADAFLPRIFAALHINDYVTRHSECIVTGDSASADYFTGHVDAAAVYVNASTRFTDGEEFGFGAEIGISTQKLHARGPMGPRELTSYKYVVRGTGQIR